MAKPDQKWDTNVPSTIAGFYFQIILACYEICQDGIRGVGVETDADVVAIDNTGEKFYIESKIHAKEFGRFSEDVKKTIYNFYNGLECQDCYEQFAPANRNLKWRKMNG